MKRFLSLTAPVLAILGLFLLFPATSQAWVNSPNQGSRQIQGFINGTPSAYYNNYSNYYPGNFAFNPYNSYYNGYGNYYGYNGYNLNPNTTFGPNGVIVQPQAGFQTPFGFQTHGQIFVPGYYQLPY